MCLEHIDKLKLLSEVQQRRFDFFKNHYKEICKWSDILKETDKILKKSFAVELEGRNILREIFDKLISKKKLNL